MCFLFILSVQSFSLAMLPSITVCVGSAADINLPHWLHKLYTEYMRIYSISTLRTDMHFIVNILVYTVHACIPEEINFTENTQLHGSQT